MNDDIIVEVAGVNYAFKLLQNPLKEMVSDRLIIILFGKRNKIKDVWMCNAVVDDATQQHMENILVNKGHKRMTKNHGMVRVDHIDGNSMSLRGPDPKKHRVDLVIMNDIIYVANKH